jgi:hypothetical protein
MDVGVETSGGGSSLQQSQTEVILRVEPVIGFCSYTPDFDHDREDPRLVLDCYFSRTALVGLV